MPNGKLTKRIEQLEAELGAAQGSTDFAAVHDTLHQAFKQLTAEDWKMIAQQRWNELGNAARVAWEEHEKVCPRKAEDGSGCIHRERLQRAAPAMVIFLREQIEGEGNEDTEPKP